MPKLVKVDSCIPDDWVLVEKDADIPENLSVCLVPLDTFLTLGDSASDVGVWLDSADDVNLLADHIGSIPVIACRFATFADGRSFSQARILREQLDYKGEIRAIGHFIQDQFFYLLRCGFSEFSVADDTDIDSLRESMHDFSDSYQAACDVSEPLFRRRA